MLCVVTVDKWSVQPSDCMVSQISVCIRLGGVVLVVLVVVIVVFLCGVMNLVLRSSEYHEI